MKKSLTVKLKVVDRCWTVKYVDNGQRGSGRFCSGWGAFSRENDLQVGDVCVFQLINTDAMVLETTIIRKNAEKIDRSNIPSFINVKVEDGVEEDDYVV